MHWNWRDKAELDDALEPYTKKGSIKLGISRKAAQAHLAQSLAVGSITDLACQLHHSGLQPAAMRWRERELPCLHRGLPAPSSQPLSRWETVETEVVGHSVML